MSWIGAAANGSHARPRMYGSKPRAHAAPMFASNVPAARPDLRCQDSGDGRPDGEDAPSPDMLENCENRSLAGNRPVGARSVRSRAALTTKSSVLRLRTRPMDGFRVSAKNRMGQDVMNMSLSSASATSFSEDDSAASRRTHRSRLSNSSASSDASFTTAKPIPSDGVSPVRGGAAREDDVARVSRALDRVCIASPSAHADGEDGAEEADDSKDEITEDYSTSSPAGDGAAEQEIDGSRGPSEDSPKGEEEGAEGDTGTESATDTDGLEARGDAGAEVGANDPVGERTALAQGRPQAADLRKQRERQKRAVEEAVLAYPSGPDHPLRWLKEEFARARSELPASRRRAKRFNAPLEVDVPHSVGSASHQALLALLGDFGFLPSQRLPSVPGSPVVCLAAPLALSLERRVCLAAEELEAREAAADATLEEIDEEDEEDEEEVQEKEEGPTYREADDGMLDDAAQGVEAVGVETRWTEHTGSEPHEAATAVPCTAPRTPAGRRRVERRYRALGLDSDDDSEDAVAGERAPAQKAPVGDAAQRASVQQSRESVQSIADLAARLSLGSATTTSSSSSSSSAGLASRPRSSQQPSVASPGFGGNLSPLSHRGKGGEEGPYGATSPLTRTEFLTASLGPSPAVHRSRGDHESEEEEEEEEDFDDDLGPVLAPGAMPDEGAPQADLPHRRGFPRASIACDKQRPSLLDLPRFSMAAQAGDGSRRASVAGAAAVRRRPVPLRKKRVATAIKATVAAFEGGRIEDGALAARAEARARPMTRRRASLVAASSGAAKGRVRHLAAMYERHGGQRLSLALSGAPAAAPAGGRGAAFAPRSRAEWPAQGPPARPQKRVSAHPPTPVREAQLDTGATEPGTPSTPAPPQATSPRQHTRGPPPALARGAALANVLEFLDEGSLLRGPLLACRDWFRATGAVLDWKKSSMHALGRYVSGEHALPALAQQLGRAFPWGRFLSEGAYKQVFMVVFKPLGRVEAVAVMDIRQIADTGNEAVVAQEVQCGILLSELVRSGACPHFVANHQVLVTSTGAPPRWGNREEPCPRGPSPPSPYSLPPPPSADEDGQSTEHGVYLYIRMELCDLGDAEEHMKALPDQAFPVPEIPPLFLQMVIALHEAQRRFSMRHYDVKLLNFFLKSMTEDDAADVHREYAHHGRSLAVPEECPLVKLADYGTADMSADTLNQPLTVDQFTTLENSAPEMLVLGACATQAFAIDAWAMGLCLAHLLTGEAPYEELLETVASPEPLRRALAKEWLRGEGPFQTLFDVFEDDTEDHVLPDTLYRVFVLFDLLPRLEAVLQDGAVEAECHGASPQSGEELGGPYAAEVDAWRHSRVWDALRSKLQPRRGKGTKAQQQFEADCARYSLFHGSHPTMKAAQRRMASIPGCEEALRGLTCPFASQRLLPRHLLDPSVPAATLFAGCEV